MTGRTGSADESKGSTNTGRPLLVGALALALAATAVLVLSDDGRLLRLGIVAALWAALVGAFLAAKYRRQALDRDEEAADMQAVYELELEREVYARREYELQVEAEAKRKAEEESREQLDELRRELGTLRETLQALLGGEVLVERFALQAEATRMRSLPEESRPLVTRKSSVKRLNPSQREDPAKEDFGKRENFARREDMVVPADAQTEMIDRVVQPPPREPARDRQQPRDAREARRPVQKPQRPNREPQRPNRETPRPGRQPAGREDQWFERMPVGQPDTVEGSGWWDPVTPPEPERPARGPAAAKGRAGDAPEATRKVAAVDGPPGSLADRLSRGRPEGEGRGPQGGRPGNSAAVAGRSAPARRGEQAPEQATSVVPPVAPPSKAPKRDQPGREQPGREQPGREQPGRRGGDRTAFATPAAARDEDAPQGGGRGRRRAADTGEQPAVAPPVAPPPAAAAAGQPGARGGDAGRRHRGEDSATRYPAVTPGRSAEDDDVPSGRRARGRAQADEADVPAESSGSHSEGKSVTELLAAHGGSDSPRRRRRRSD